MMTHLALERDVKAALSEIDRLEQIGEATMMIRVEDENERESDA